ncbi:hypothetical protein [Loktanella sp. M215]|nr:hypothetical protein [Loktanella sp. M215]
MLVRKNGLFRRDQPPQLNKNHALPVPAPKTLILWIWAVRRCA